MSIETPPRRPRANPDEERRRQRRYGADPFQPSLFGRAYASVTAPFRLQDGKGRIRALLLVALFVFSLFAARLVDLQVVDSESMASQARGSRMVKVELPPLRGTIYDATGVELAKSQEARDITVDPHMVRSIPEYAAKLSPILGIPEAEIATSLQPKTNANGTKIRFAYIAKQQKLETWDKVRALALPGIWTRTSSVRVYPAGTLAANLLGYTNDEGHGAAGLEAMLDKELAGTPGEKIYEASSSGGEIPTGNGMEVAPTAGSSYRLTINRDLQWILQQSINKSVKEHKADNVVAVALEVGTGRILASAQAPVADPNDQRNKDPNLKNLAVAQLFEPGSTAKVMTLAAAIEEGAVTPMTVFTVPNRLPRGGENFQDDVDHPTYKMTVAGILAQSSNIGTIQIAEKIGPHKLYEYWQRFGLGQPTGLNYPGESTGTIIHPDSGMWSPTAFPTMTFGQSMSVNAVQIANVIATIANKGMRITPRLIDSVERPDGTVERPGAPEAVRVVSEQTAAQVSEMMEQVVRDVGTAPQAAIEGYRVAGKTGTAHRYDEQKRTYSGYVASFVGYAPADDPKIVLAVITNNPRGQHFGSTTGGPVFHEVMTAALSMMNVPPSGQESPELMLHTPKSTKGGPWNWR